MEDEIVSLKYLKLLCEQNNDLEIVKVYNDPQLFLESVKSIDFDLCIMDIEMPGINGLKVAEYLPGKQIIFITAYKEYAVDAFELEAADYLVKPVVKERFDLAIKKALRNFTLKFHADKNIQLQTDKGKSIINPDSIIYIRASEIDSRDKVIVLSTNEVLTLKNISFEKLLNLLPESFFCQVNKKEVISKNYIRHYSNKQLVLAVNEPEKISFTITISEQYRKLFLELMEK